MLINKQITEIFKLLLNLPIETCGIIKFDNDVPVLEIHVSKHNTKNNCVHKYYGHHIFHTHIHKDESFPSAHDIVKVMKNSSIKTSLISTHWGIWEIISEKKYNFTCDEQAHITKTIEKMLAPLHDYKKYNLHVEKYIQDVETKYNEFKLHINFQSWNHLDK